jgi:FtsP/CotA-like multicopper oxidase with cupredoxin domain
VVINGPATSNYDIDLGPYPITDWLQKLSAYQYLDISNASLQFGHAPPPMDSILINGTNKNSQGGGTYSVTELTPGKKHRIRIMNTAAESQIRVTLDGHNFTVIANDFVPVKPFTTDQLLVAIGQRYDVIVTANQPPGNYWFRANIATDCQSADNFNGLAIFNYQGTTVSNPKTSSVNLSSTCVEPSGMTPWWSTTVPSSDFESQVESLSVDLAVPNVTTNGGNVVAWIVNLESIDISWDKPTLQYVLDGNTDYPKVYNLLEIPNADTVSTINQRMVFSYSSSGYTGLFKSLLVR